MTDMLRLGAMMMIGAGVGGLGAAASVHGDWLIVTWTAVLVTGILVRMKEE